MQVGEEIEMRYHAVAENVLLNKGHDTGNEFLPLHTFGVQQKAQWLTARGEPEEGTRVNAQSCRSESAA